MPTSPQEIERIVEYAETILARLMSLQIQSQAGHSIELNPEVKDNLERSHFLLADVDSCVSEPNETDEKRVGEESPRAEQRESSHKGTA